MRLHPHEFIRRFLLHVLPRGFHRIRHYGLLASANRAESIATARALLGADPPAVEARKQPDITPMHGYRNNPAANSAVFVDGWLRTGDIGKLDEEGYVTLVGRSKEMINRGGEKSPPPRSRPCA